MSYLSIVSKIATRDVGQVCPLEEKQLNISAQKVDYVLSQVDTFHVNRGTYMSKKTMST